MERTELLNKALHLLQSVPQNEAINYSKAWLNQDTALVVINPEEYYQCIEEIFLSDKIVSSRFSRKSVFKRIEDVILNHRKNGTEITQNTAQSIFEDFNKVPSYSANVVAPISGIRLDNTAVGHLEFSVFKLGRLEDLEFPIANSEGYYIKTAIDGSYDQFIAIEKAKDAFEDFSRLITFISGKNDNSILIKIGLPLYPSISHEKMYVETSSFQVIDDSGKFDQSNISNRFLEKVPVDNHFFCKSTPFIKLWDIYEKQHNNKNLSDIHKRIINASLAVGESAKSENIKNSIIYTCIALEILFSFDEGSIFQKSIADRLADTFAFIVAKDKDSRLFTVKLLKKVYQMRSALVHGGKKQLTNDYVAINILLRAAISELLNNEKYAHIKKIDGLYEMVKDAHYSY